MSRPLGTVRRSGAASCERLPDIPRQQIFGQHDVVEPPRLRRGHRDRRVRDRRRRRRTAGAAAGAGFAASGSRSSHAAASICARASSRRRHRMLAQRDLVVPIDFVRLDRRRCRDRVRDAPRCRVGVSHSGSIRDARRTIASVVADVAAGRHVERDQPVGVVHAALAADDGAVTGRQRHRDRLRLCGRFGDAIRISGEQCLPQLRLVDAIAIRIAEQSVARRAARLLGDLAKVRRHRVHRSMNRQQIAGRGGARAVESAPAPTTTRRPRILRTIRAPQSARAPAADAAAGAASGGRAAVIWPSVNRAEPRQQRHRRCDRDRRSAGRTIRRCPADAPQARIDSSGAGQIDAMNLGFAMRPQSIARVPQPPDDAGPEPRGAAGALIGAVERDALGRQRIDAAIGVVARDLLQAGVDHRRHAGNGQRCFGDVGRRRSCAARRSAAWRQRGILFGRHPASRAAAPGRHRWFARRRPRHAIVAAISRAPGRKHSTLPRVRGSSSAQRVGDASRQGA